MPDPATPRTGGQILIDQLRRHGVDRVFCVPGESYLAALDALHDVASEIEVIVCRQEGGAAYMAEAYGKLTGRPGICFVTRGPGAANASVGVHTAFQDSTPMIILIGQVARDQAEREAFQEIDYRRFYGEITKWTAQVEAAARLPELVSQAFHRAVNGRPGPVALALPEDMLTEVATVPDALPYARARQGVGAADLAALREALAAAHRPLMVLGGGGWSAQAVADMRAFAEVWALPVAASFRCQDLFDNTHPNYAGDLGIAAGAGLLGHVREADLLLVVGARLGEITTGGYALIDVPTPKQRLIHVHPGAEELGRVYHAALPVNASVAGFAQAAAGLAPPGDLPWREWTAAAHAAYEGHLRPVMTPGAVQMAQVMEWLRGHLPADAILTNGAGNYASWVHRFYQYRQFRTQLAPTNGSMGYGTPAAIAAKLTCPERSVVAFAGDGCFLMNGQELATAVQYGAKIIVLVINNGMYGTIRMHQERHYPGRITGTALHNPDFAALARSYGAHGELVTTTDAFAAAFRRAESAGLPAVIEIRLDPEALTLRMSLTEIRTEALRRQST